MLLQRWAQHHEIYTCFPCFLSIVSDLTNRSIQGLNIVKSVTAVGGTVGIPETAAFFSGGGFSNYVSNFDTYY
jgi:hypothetical protein